ncbi:MAG: zf-HC2 domain-containing protein [Eubacteriales bacterium]
MDCNVIKDLIPLYIDDCCSEESADIVKKHIASCPECKTLYENMHNPSEIKPAIYTTVNLSRINAWKASVLQSSLLFLSFALIIIGVALESSTPQGATNGYWAVSLIVPATGFMLSLANWYFIRLYKSRKAFSNYSCLSTLGFTVPAYIWACLHYKFSISFTNLFKDIILFWGIGIILTAIFCVLSKLLSNKYAKMLGKE